MKLLSAGLVLALWLSLAAASRAAESPWAELARTDIVRMAALMRDNHPGPVDPENPAYAQRLEAIYPRALEKAASAASFFDYKRAILFYTNAFRDGHTGVIFKVDPTAYEWPGFDVVLGDDGVYRIEQAEPGLPVKPGDVVESCDGRAIDQLMHERIDPYYWNVDLPHERSLHAAKLFVLEAGDEPSRIGACRIRDGGSSRDVALAWRPLPRERADQLRAKHFYEGAPTLTRSGGAWIVRLPTFMFQTPEQTADIERLLAQMKAHQSELRAGRVVLDLRGNTGGGSDWGDEVAVLIWGEPTVRRVAGSFDWTVDWRASPANLQKIDDTIARYRKNNLTEALPGLTATRDAISRALSEGRPLARVPNPPDAAAAPAPPSPFNGRAYVVTDGFCASACLDFMDIARRMPNTLQVGWPTSADTVYIDNTLVTLPSGLAFFGYSMKVYRHRVRSNNQWYDPQVRWPGGPATDDAVAAWLARLTAGPTTQAAAPR